MVKPIRQLAVVAAAALSITLPARAAEPTVDIDTALRCSAVFGIVAADQKHGVASALKYPSLDKRGREFFVQTGARLMDEQKLTRPAVQAKFQAEVARLKGEASAAKDPDGAVRAVMTPCLALLDAAIPAP